MIMAISHRVDFSGPSQDARQTRMLVLAADRMQFQGLGPTFGKGVIITTISAEN